MADKQHMPPVSWLRERFYVDEGILRFAIDNGKARKDASVGHLTKNGYLITKVTFQGRRISLLVHRVIISLKIERSIENYEEVDHIDRNKLGTSPHFKKLAKRI